MSDKLEATTHGPEPMDDERLERMRLAVRDYGGLTQTEGRELVTEVDRLRALVKAQSELLVEYQAAKLGDLSPREGGR